MKTNEFETLSLSNIITSKQAQELLNKTLEREQEDKCIIEAIDHLERWIGKKVQRELNEEIGFEVTAMKEDTFEVVKAIRFEDSVIYQAPYYVKEYKNKLELVEHPLIVKCREIKEKYEPRMKEIEITNDQFRQWIAHIYELQQAERPNNEYRIIAPVTLDDISADIKRMFGLEQVFQEETCKGESMRVRSNKPVSVCKLRVDAINGDISEDEFLKALKEQRDLIQRLVKESKSNRV